MVLYTIGYMGSMVTAGGKIKKRSGQPAPLKAGYKPGGCGRTGFNQQQVGSLPVSNPLMMAAAHPTPFSTSIAP
jgi:hypothetical protein